MQLTVSIDSYSLNGSVYLSFLIRERIKVNELVFVVYLKFLIRQFVFQCK